MLATCFTSLVSCFSTANIDEAAAPFLAVEGFLYWSSAKLHGLVLWKSLSRSVILRLLLAICLENLQWQNHVTLDDVEPVRHMCLPRCLSLNCFLLDGLGVGLVISIWKPVNSSNLHWICVLENSDSLYLQSELRPNNECYSLPCLATYSMGLVQPAQSRDFLWDFYHAFADLVVAVMPCNECSECLSEIDADWGFAKVSRLKQSQGPLLAGLPFFFQLLDQVWRF